MPAQPWLEQQAPLAARHELLKACRTKQVAAQTQQSKLRKKQTASMCCVSKVAVQQQCLPVPQVIQILGNYDPLKGPRRPKAERGWSVSPSLQM